MLFVTLKIVSGPASEQREQVFLFLEDAHPDLVILHFWEIIVSLTDIYGRPEDGYHHQDGSYNELGSDGRNHRIGSFGPDGHPVFVDLDLLPEPCDDLRRLVLVLAQVLSGQGPRDASALHLDDFPQPELRFLDLFLFVAERVVVLVVLVLDAAKIVPEGKLAGLVVDVEGILLHDAVCRSGGGGQSQRCGSRVAVVDLLSALGLFRNEVRKRKGRGKRGDGGRDAEYRKGKDAKG